MRVAQSTIHIRENTIGISKVYLCVYAISVDKTKTVPRSFLKILHDRSFM